MTLKENQIKTNAHYKARQIEISKGISAVINEVFSVETKGGAVLSEEMLIARFRDRWYEEIRNYLNSIDDNFDLDASDFVPTVIGINYHCGSVDVKPSSAHEKLALGEYVRYAPLRGCITRYLQENDTLAGNSPTDENDVIYEPPTPQPVVIEECDAALCLTGSDVFEHIDGRFIRKDHLSPESFGVRDDWYGRTDSDGNWIPLGPLKSLRGEDKPVARVDVSGLKMVSWLWVEEHPNELRVGMIAFPSSTGITVGSNVSIYMGEGKWQSIQIKM